MKNVLLVTVALGILSACGTVPINGTSEQDCIVSSQSLVQISAMAGDDYVQATRYDGTTFKAGVGVEVFAGEGDDCVTTLDASQAHSFNGGPGTDTLRLLSTIFTEECFCFNNKLRCRHVDDAPGDATDFDIRNFEHIEQGFEFGPLGEYYPVEGCPYMEDPPAICRHPLAPGNDCSVYQ